MSTSLKCPNPSCPYLFDPATVPTGVVLACPRCTTRFTLESPAATSAAAPPSAGPGAAFAGMSPATSPLTECRNPRLPVRGSRLQSTMLYLVGAVALAGAGVAVWYKITHKTEIIPVDTVIAFKELNFAMEPPPSPWIRDGNMRGHSTRPTSWSSVEMIPMDLTKLPHTSPLVQKTL